MRIIGQSRAEFSTQQVVETGGYLYYRLANGGTRGAHSTGGDRFPEVLEPTREIDAGEATALLLDWGYDPDDCDIEDGQ